MVKFLAKFLAKYFIPISIGVAIIIIAVGVRFMIIRVEIDRIGVKTAVWGFKRGVVQKDYKPGWHRYIRQIETWDLYDGTVQTLNLTQEARNAEGKIENREIRIRTADDYNVTVDMIIKYQITKGKAHKIRQEIGPGDRYKMFVENEAKDVARSVLGKMSEKDLYNPEEKRRRAEEARVLLASQLKSRHVDIIDWLILDLRFDAQLERKIKNVKLAELDELLNTSKEKAVAKRGITQTIDATTEALAQKIQSEKDGSIVKLKADMNTKVTEIIAEADKFRIEKKAEGDHYKHVKHAAGELLVDRAKAEGERLRRQAMTGLGGDLIVALEAARNINLEDIVVSTQDIDLLNVEEMIMKLGAGLKSDLPALEKYNSTSLMLSEDLPDELKQGHGEENKERGVHEYSAPPEVEEPEQQRGKGHDSFDQGQHDEHRNHSDFEEPQTQILKEWGTLTEEFPVSQ